MIVLGCGGRNYTNKERIFNVMDALNAKVNIHEVVHGAAKGADRLVGFWAEERGIPVKAFPVNWKQNGVYDPQAAFDRNQRMLDEGKPDLVIAFPGSGGTADMVRRSKEAGVKVFEIDKT